MPTMEAAVGSSVCQADSRFSESSCRENMLSYLIQISASLHIKSCHWGGTVSKDTELHHLGTNMYL